jgi:hypothetical protein
MQHDAEGQNSEVCMGVIWRTLYMYTVYAIQNVILYSDIR